MTNQIQTELQEERMSSLQIAEITGKNHADVLRSIRKMEAPWIAVGQSKFALSSYMNTQNKLQPCYLLTKTECLYIATKFNDEARAKLVVRWAELEKAERQSQNSVRRIPTIEEVDTKLHTIDIVSQKMNLNESSKAIMYNGVLEEVGVKTIDYVPSNGVLRPISYILKQGGISMSAQAANKVLLDKGFLRICTRKSKSGKDKQFYNITDKGATLGENKVSPQNPSETQPMWYESKSNEIINILK